MLNYNCTFYSRCYGHTEPEIFWSHDLDFRIAVSRAVIGQ